MRKFILPIALLLILSSQAAAVAAAPQNTPAGDARKTAAPAADWRQDAFLDTLQRRTIQYFIDTTPVENGLAPDRWPSESYCSIAAVGFAMTALPIAVERGMMKREEAARRVVNTLRTFHRLPDHPQAETTTSHKGFYYHFIKIPSGERAWQCELSSVDTGLLLMGALFCQSYFDGSAPVEAEIRRLADSLYLAADWNWFMNGKSTMSMGWHPEQGFNATTWTGYMEAMFLYLLGLGSPTHPLPESVWKSWCSTYSWAPYYGEEFISFGPLFGHQFSHVWIDFRGIQDDFMRQKGIDYFENSRRATLSQRRYAIANPDGWRDYGENIWGFTPCDGPADKEQLYQGERRQFHTYAARGVSFDWKLDDGTIAPYAAGSSIPFAPEICIPALKEMRRRYGQRLWTKYGFLDSFNPSYRYDEWSNTGWFDKDYLGIDQGPMLAMIENYRSGLIWKTLKKNPNIQRGLRRAGFGGGWLDEQVLDDFGALDNWKVIASDGVELKASLEPGRSGTALRIDFNFVGGGGYGGVQGKFPMILPENLSFSFNIRGEAPANNLEFKLVDRSGDNVWWNIRRNYRWPEEWTRVSYKKRHISFAWGPTSDQTLREMDKLEFMISSASGGKGTIWIDDLRLTTLPPPDPQLPPLQARTRTSREPGRGPGLITDGDPGTIWHSDPKGGREEVILTLAKSSEIGGLVLDWGEKDYPTRYTIDASSDGAAWEEVYRVERGKPGRAWIPLPELDTRALRINLEESSRGLGCGLAEAALRDLHFSETPEAFYAAVAAGSPAGLFPRYLYGEQSYWTVNGVNNSRQEALFNSDGMVEVDKGSFSIEPMLAIDGRLITWHDVRSEATLAEGYLPLPSVRWEGAPVSLTVSAFSDGPERDGKVLDKTAGSAGAGQPSASQTSGSGSGQPTPASEAGTGQPNTVNGATAGKTGSIENPGGSGGAASGDRLFLTYTLENNSSQPHEVRLYLALRPFQVNPPWQFLNWPGGFAPIKSIRLEGRRALINGEKAIDFLEAPHAFGAAAFDEGDISAFLARGLLPAAQAAAERRGYLSTAAQYSWTLAPGERRTVHLQVPFAGVGQVPTAVGEPGSAAASLPATASSSADESHPAAPSLPTAAAVDSLRADVADFWRRKVHTVGITLPAAAQDLVETLHANLAYILINRDGPGIQPGSRSYDRSWIRDGALTSAALLRFGVRDEVRAYLDWYSGYLYPSGKVPCVVDRRGADPVDENDSNGEYLFAMRQYFIFTGDTAFLAGHWDKIRAAAAYLDTLAGRRMTSRYRPTGHDSSDAFYGLLPESISHEGYSAKPMHSYWDNFFALRGYNDAVAMARVLGRREDETWLRRSRDLFQKNLLASLERAIRYKKIDYLPGCVELGDFDATSTAIGLYPGNLASILPQPQLQNTFDRYFTFFSDRRDGRLNWREYTPYEVRTIGAFVRLGQPERAHALLDFFMGDRRPAGWRHWAEVVWKDPKAPRFIGDMPHTWVGSDFINSVRTLFLYEDEAAGRLVIGAGLRPEWLEAEGGVAMENMPSYYGPVSCRFEKKGKVLRIELAGKISAVPGGIEIHHQLGKKPSRVLVNGRKAKSWDGRCVAIDGAPAVIEIN